MRTVTLALLLLGVALASAASDRRMLAEDAGGAIVNGQDAAPGRYRYYALIKTTGGSFCGSTLISPNVVLTAAHCMFGETGDVHPASVWTVYVGEEFSDVTTPQPRAVRGVKSFTIHPDYKKTTPDRFNNDLALLVLDAPVTGISPVRLTSFVAKPDWHNPVPDNTPVMAVGLGRTNFDPRTYPTKLQEIGLTLLPLQQCQQEFGTFAPILPDFKTNNMICAKKLNGDGLTCKGDSGGPLIVRGATAAQDIQIGVTSWSNHDDKATACRTFPAAFANIGSLVPWIVGEVVKLTGERIDIGPPFTPVRGRVYGDMTVQGFDGAVFPQPGLPGQQLDIVLSPQYAFKGRLVPGSRAMTAALGSVGFTWFDHVYVRLERGELTASVGAGAPLRRGQTARLLGGSLEVIANKPGWSRRVDISKPGVEIRVVQPWVKTGRKNGGYYAQRLEVYFTLTQRPAGPLAGFLGATYKP